MIEKLRYFLNCLYLAAVDTVEHDGIEHAGYLSFITLLSLFPFLVFFTALASTLAKLLNQYDINQKFILFMIDNVPHDIISGLIPRINEIISGPPQSLLTLAIIGAVWTSSSAVEAIRTILNRALRASSPHPYIMRRLLSIVQFLVITSVIIITITFMTLVPIAFNLLDKEWGYIKYAITLFILLIAITYLYYMIPNTKQRIAEVIPGAVVATSLWATSSIVFTQYLKTFHQLNIIYGSLAGIIVSLIFFYVLSFFFIYGAELNYRLNEKKKIGI